MDRRLLIAVLGVLLIVGSPVIAGAQITSAGNGNWSEGTTWVGGVAPTSTDDVVINAGDTVTVHDYNAVGQSISFTGNDAQIKMAPNSRLTVYGDFTLFSDSMCVFDEQWSATDAKIVFAGSAVQTLSGWSTSGGSTSFRDMVIDKTGGKVTTGGNDMRLGIQNSFEIINGLFELAEQDDIEGRWATSGNYTYLNKPTVFIHPGGEFETIDGAGAHHIRAGSDTLGFMTPIGEWTVQGWARFRDGSTIKYNFLSVDVDSGGKIITSTGNGGGQLEWGPVRVKAGAEIENYSTSDMYGSTVVFTLDEGGLFDTKSSSTIFPASFINNGTVRYSRDSSTDQTIVDQDYHRLEISLDTDNVKNWTLTANRSIADELETSSSGTLVITGTAAESLTVGTSLRLTSGTLDNSDSNVSLVMADGTTINRATGTITNAPVFAGMVDVRYLSSVASVTTGPELPTATGVLNDLQVWSTDQTVTLGANAQVNGELTLSNGIFDNDGAGGTEVLTLADGAEIRRGSGSLTAAPTFGGSVSVDYISTLTSVTTGPELPTAAGVLADLTVSGDQGVTLGADVTVNGACTISGSDLTTDSYTVTLGSAGSLSEADSITVVGNVTTTRTASQGVNESFGGIGLEINAAGAAPGATTVLRVTGDAKSIYGAQGIERYFEVTPSNNTGLDATVVVHYDHSELNGIPEADLAHYASYDGGSDWVCYSGVVNEVANTETSTGIDSFALLTLGGDTAGVGDVVEERPNATRLVSAYPNPFNQATRVVFEVAERAPVKVAVYDIMGREVRTLHEGALSAGRHDITWQGLDDAGNQVATGVYFCRMKAGDVTQTRKVVFSK